MNGPDHLCLFHNAPRLGFKTWRDSKMAAATDFALLRVQTFLRKTFQVYHVYWKFTLGYICRITVKFGTLKDGSLLNDIFHQTIVLATETLLKWCRWFVKIHDAFLTKSWTFHLVQIIQLWSNFVSLWHKHLLWNYKWSFRLLMSAFAMVRRNILLEH